MLSFKQYIEEKYIIPAVKAHIRALDKSVTGPINTKRQKEGKPLLTTKQKIGIHASRVTALAAGGAATSGAVSSMMNNNKPGVAAGAALASVGAFLVPHILDTIKFRNKLKGSK